MDICVLLELALKVCPHGRQTCVALVSQWAHGCSFEFRPVMIVVKEERKRCVFHVYSNEKFPSIKFWLAHIWRNIRQNHFSVSIGPYGASARHKDRYAEFIHSIDLICYDTRMQQSAHFSQISWNQCESVHGICGEERKRKQVDSIHGHNSQYERNCIFTILESNKLNHSWIRDNDDDDNNNHSSENI